MILFIYYTFFLDAQVWSRFKAFTCWWRPFARNVGKTVFFIFFSYLFRRKNTCWWIFGCEVTENFHGIHGAALVRINPIVTWKRKYNYEIIHARRARLCKSVPVKELAIFFWFLARLYEWCLPPLVQMSSLQVGKMAFP